MARGVVTKTLTYSISLGLAAMAIARRVRIPPSAHTVGGSPNHAVAPPAESGSRSFRRRDLALLLSAIGLVVSTLAAAFAFFQSAAARSEAASARASAGAAQGSLALNQAAAEYGALGAVRVDFDGSTVSLILENRSQIGLLRPLVWYVAKTPCPPGPDYSEDGCLGEVQIALPTVLRCERVVIGVKEYGFTSDRGIADYRWPFVLFLSPTQQVMMTGRQGYERLPAIAAASEPSGVTTGYRQTFELYDVETSRFASLLPDTLYEGNLSALPPNQIDLTDSTHPEQLAGC